MFEGAKIAEDILQILFTILIYLAVLFLCCIICLTFLFLQDIFVIGAFFEGKAGALLELLNKCTTFR
jgi:hypothetical protein